MPAPDQIVGDASALVAAIVVIFVDCHTALRQLTSQINPIKYWRFWLVAVLCGLLAGACSQCATAKWLNDNVAQIKVYNPWRGLLIGLAVLTIIRSKFFNAGKNDSPIGGEYFYNGGRLWAVQGAWDKWIAEKTAFNTPEKRLSLNTDATHENRVELQVQNRLRPSANRVASSNNELTNLRGTKPAAGAAAPALDFYNEKFVNLVLDYCGISFSSSII